MGKYLDLYDVTAGNPVAERELAEMRERIEELEADNEGLRRWRRGIEEAITRSGDVAQGYIEGTEKAMRRYWTDYYQDKKRLAKLEAQLNQEEGD